jgi:hypothetical protein
VSTWRLLGELPQASTREEMRAQFIGEWNPWASHWFALTEFPIVVPDPRNPALRCHVKTFETGISMGRRRFAADLLDGIWRIYVPAVAGASGAFEASKPLYEGFWRTADTTSQRRVGNPDWPVPGSGWTGREVFLASLDHVEQTAKKIAYRGYSSCRICGCRNGDLEYQFMEWVWPSGFRHYVDEHHVRPSEEFQNFISQWAA